MKRSNKSVRHLAVWFAASISTTTVDRATCFSSRGRYVQATAAPRRLSKRCPTAQKGWLDYFLPNTDNDDDKAADARRSQYPEQYPATYELSTVTVADDDAAASYVRPLLKGTQLERRPLHTAFDASKHGWHPTAFHARVDGKGAAVVLAKTADGRRVLGGYNPKGWSSLGGARPSVAAFLFYQADSGRLEKLRKVGGGGLACAVDDPNFGISFGPDALVIPMQKGAERLVQSKLGPYYERGPDAMSSLLDGVTCQVDSLVVLVGKYDADEEIPYSGAVLDMTSG